MMDRVAPAVRLATPRVIIPVFPGTNCEYDTARAFRRAGGDPHVLVLKNLTPADVAESCEALVKELDEAQILMLPGGFSGGDEPDGSAKFIAAFFRAPAVADAVNRLLNQRDGLALGICNGFQALIKLGLVPYGEIRPITENDPTLTFNTIHRHQSMLVRTRIASNKSPWLSECDINDEHLIAISHGEGRFVCNDDLLQKLIANGQIATQYVDLTCQPTMDLRYNPNGSVLAIEGITSPDGRVFGKMGHSERTGNQLYKNVTGDKFSPSSRAASTTSSCNERDFAMAQHDRYISPFSTRYASDEMQYIFSDDNKFRTWRKLWIALAKAEQKQGLAITDEQIAELEAHKDDINYEDAIAREKLVRHDVMSHVYAYGLQCPKAKGIIHLGATSCYVGDNTDIIIMREALQLVRKKIIGVLANLAKFAEQYKAMPCLAYTHCQPAQLTTVGKRATLWMNELYMDLEEIDHQIGQLALRGVKGTTGTQASFMELFNGDSAKVKAVEADVCAQMGFTKVVPVCGQTYSRKVDYNVLSAVAGLGQSAMKMATDIRLLANFKEMEEPFEKNQIGSSAMPYKRNPMRCERICALSRYLMVDVLNPAMTAGTQWFERTLDDSANKRIAMAEGFLAADAILNILLNVSDGLVVYPKVIRARVMAELPFMASENIMMRAVKKGGDRQELHERLREHAVSAAAVVKQEGKPNDMIARVEADPPSA